MHVRPPTDDQYGDIHRLLATAFGQSDEARLVARLRRDDDIAIELVAEEGSEVLGYIALPRLMSPPRGLALAPVAVKPSRQRGGIGSMLIGEALSRARALGVQVVVVLGDPAYYERFGFSAKAASGLASVYAGPHFMVLQLDEKAARSGQVIYPKAFDEL